MSQLIVVCGLPGSGKSTLAARLARSLQAEWISSDAVRAEAGLRGDYRIETIATVYLEMLERARVALERGTKVVLDGSFSSRRFRVQALELAGSLGAEVKLILMVASEEQALERVERKRPLTEAGADAYLLLRDNFDPIEGEHLVLDSSRGNLGRLLKRALRYLESG